MDAHNSQPVTFKLEWCKKCAICVEFCPRKALVVGSKDYPELARPDACTYCRLCEIICPDFAVTVAQRPKRAGAQED